MLHLTSPTMQKEAKLRSWLPNSGYMLKQLGVFFRDPAHQKKKHKKWWSCGLEGTPSSYLFLLVELTLFSFSSVHSL